MFSTFRNFVVCISLGTTTQETPFLKFCQNPGTFELRCSWSLITADPVQSTHCYPHYSDHINDQDFRAQTLICVAFGICKFPLDAHFFFASLFNMKSLSTLIFETKSNVIMFDRGFIFKMTKKKSEHLRGTYGLFLLLHLIGC